jgi:hypothetical protein
MRRPLALVALLSLALVALDQGAGRSLFSRPGRLALADSPWQTRPGRLALADSPWQTVGRLAEFGAYKRNNS